jgi:hypothetical protein
MTAELLTFCCAFEANPKTPGEQNRCRALRSYALARGTCHVHGRSLIHLATADGSAGNRRLGFEEALMARFDLLGLRHLLALLFSFVV